MQRERAQHAVEGAVRERQRLREVRDEELAPPGAAQPGGLDHGRTDIDPGDLTAPVEQPLRMRACCASGVQDRRAGERLVQQLAHGPPLQVLVPQVVVRRCPPYRQATVYGTTDCQAPACPAPACPVVSGPAVSGPAVSGPAVSGPAVSGT